MHVQVLGSQALMKVHFMRIAPPPYFVKKKKMQKEMKMKEDTEKRLQDYRDYSFIVLLVTFRSLLPPLFFYKRSVVFVTFGD